MLSLNALIHSVDELSSERQLLIVFSLAIVTVSIIYQMKKKKLSIQKNEREKGFGSYTYRDLFHFFLNEEFHSDKFGLAREFSEQMHIEAREYMMVDHPDDPDFPDHFTYIPYDKEKVQAKLEYIQERLFKQRYLDWCDAGQPVSADTRYWWAQTKGHLMTYFLQRAPYHLTDGVWLRGVPQGPMSSINAKLFSIYIDELGNGDSTQNHPNVYLDVLSSLGLQVPPVTSRQFVDQQAILDVSFKKPLLTLTTSLFPKSFEPEILGYTLWIEMTSTSEHAGLRKILDRYNLNPKFSLLHTAIDNNLNGHGKYIRDVVEEYLDHIEKTEGREALEKHWKRIWTGYVAYGTTGTIDDQLKELYEKQKKSTPRQEFIQLINRKSAIAQKMHGSRRIGPQQCLLNEMFASGDAEKLCDELANSDMIVKGDPKESKLLNHAVSFHGPMYQIFTADELGIISRWIFSLAPSTVNDILSLIIQRRKLAEQIQSDLTLKLPDQSNQFLRDLFQGKPEVLLSAFRASQWTMPANGAKLTDKNLQTTPLIKSIEEGGILRDVFDKDDQDKEIIRKWLLDGAPLPTETFDQQVNIRSHKAFQFQC